MDQRVKVRMGNRKVMDAKQGSVEMKWGSKDRSSGMGLHRV